MHIGVKKMSWLLSRARCPYYKKEKEEKWIPRNERHEAILSSAIKKIKSLFGSDVKCIKECGISIKIDTKVIQGRIDAICWNKDNVIIMEAKSYPIVRGSSQDILQLILYKQIITDDPDTIECSDPLVYELKSLLKKIVNTKGNYRTDANIKLYLVYRENNLQQKGNIIILDLSEYSFKDSNIESIMSAYSYSNQGDRKYLIGVWCFTCSNSSCPFRPIR